MRPLYGCTLPILLALPLASLAQQPFEQAFGVQVPTLTLSNGRYPEFFQNDSLRRIGSVIYDTRRHRVVYMIPQDSLTGLSRAEVTARWLSLDPLAAKYTSLSPYNYVANSPLMFVDPDGRKLVFANDKAYAVYNILLAKGDKATRDRLATLDSDEVVYYVELARIKDFGFGGSTELNTAIEFSGSEVNSSNHHVALKEGNHIAGIHIMIAEHDPLTPLILADEVTEAAGLLEGRQGFYETVNNFGPNNKVLGRGAFGRDATDEIMSKDASAGVEGAAAILTSNPKFLTKYSSGPLLLKMANKTATDEDRQSLVGLNGYGVNTFIGGKSKISDGSTSAERGYSNARSSLGVHNYVYRSESGELVTNPQLNIRQANNVVETQP